GWLRADPPALRRRDRRAPGQARPVAQAHRTLLRRLSDDQERPAGRGEAQSQLIMVHVEARRAGKANRAHALVAPSRARRTGTAPAAAPSTARTSSAP